ncbi:MAG: Gfo/Idh/MocA family oxidoreductase [Phycisphaerales bacterium]|jgi:predicted dehydrogenase|nr:Gfo/Idh/MocA family oxidoreductase [Phycisphaerales bacterium]
MASSTTDRNAAAQRGREGVLRCAAIGVGRMGRHHARVYAQLPDTQLVAVVDRDIERARDIAEQHGCEAVASERELLDMGVDAVSIAVPTVAHESSATPLLERGVACLIEKPLAQDAVAAGRMRDAAEKSGAVLMVGHIERFNPIMRAMQRATSITGGSEPIVPRFMEVHRVSPMTFRSVDVGVVLDMMIHDLDVVLMLMGGQEPDEIHASGVAVITEHEDICNARLTWRRAGPNRDKTCVANVTASRLALKTERVTRITGENAYIKIDYGAKKGTIIRRTANELQMEEVREQLRSGADLTSLKWQELVNVEPLEIDDEEPIVSEIRSFVDAVRNGTPPPVDAGAGLANVRTAERIVRAIRESM